MVDAAGHSLRRPSPSRAKAVPRSGSESETPTAMDLLGHRRSSPLSPSAASPSDTSSSSVVVVRAMDSLSELRRRYRAACGRRGEQLRHCRRRAKVDHAGAAAPVWACGVREQEQLGRRSEMQQSASRRGTRRRDGRWQRVDRRQHRRGTETEYGRLFHLERISLWHHPTSPVCRGQSVSNDEAAAMTIGDQELVGSGFASLAGGQRTGDDELPLD